MGSLSLLQGSLSRAQPLDPLDAIHVLWSCIVHHLSDPGPDEAILVPASAHTPDLQSQGHMGRTSTPSGRTASAMPCR